MSKIFINKFGCKLELFHFDEGTMEDGKDWTIFDGGSQRSYKTEAGAVRWLTKHGYTEMRVEK